MSKIFSLFFLGKISAGDRFASEQERVTSAQKGINPSVSWPLGRREAVK